MTVRARRNKACKKKWYKIVFFHKNGTNVLNITNKEPKILMQV